MNHRLALLAALALTALAGCASPPLPSATAVLSPTTGNSTAGTVHFVMQPSGRVLVSGEIHGLKSYGEHGFHVHEKGDCSSGDGNSAGGHFNPNGQPHGHESGPHHAGDLPSLRADAAGVALFKFESSTISVGPGIADVVGRGLIVHRDADDYTTQPTGNSGPRLACAVIVPG